MNNPLQQYTKKKEKEVPVDHAFLNRLENKLFEQASETPISKKRSWKKLILPFVLVPMTAAVALVISLFYNYNSTPTNIQPPTVALATVLEKLFRTDTKNELRRIQIEKTYIAIDGERRTSQHTFWTYNNLFREDQIITKKNQPELSDFFSRLINKDEKQECQFSKIETEEKENSCYAISSLTLHGVLKQPTISVPIQQVTPAVPKKENSVSSPYAIYIEWNSSFPVKEVNMMHYGGSSNSAFAKYSQDTRKEEYLNKKIGNTYYHRSLVEAMALSERDTLRFQIQMRMKNNTRTYSQLFVYDFEKKQLEEIAYDELESRMNNFVYQSNFSLPIYMYEHEDEFHKHMKTTFEERDGKRVTHVHFDVPKSKRNEVEDAIHSPRIGDPSWNVRVATIDFWYLPYESQLLEYQAWDNSEQLLEKTVFISDEVIHQNPDDIFSVRAWKEEMKKK